MIWADRRFRLGHGRVFALYVAAYTLGRLWIEVLRIDPANHILGLRLNVFTAIVVVGSAPWCTWSSPPGCARPRGVRAAPPTRGAPRSVAERLGTARRRRRRGDERRRRADHAGSEAQDATTARRAGRGGRPDARTGAAPDRGARRPRTSAAEYA